MPASEKPPATPVDDYFGRNKSAPCKVSFEHENKTCRLDHIINPAGIVELLKG